MKIALCSAAGFIALITLFIGIESTSPVDFVAGDNVEDEDSLEYQLRLGKELDAQLQALLRRLAAKRQIVEDLAARRLTLLEAAACFRSLNHQAPHRERRLIHLVVPGRSPEERYCRAVLNFTEARLPENESTRRLLASLERELQEHLRKGTLRLPE
jgi:hypothetical protein